MAGWKANALEMIVALVVVLLTIILRRLLIRILRQNNKPRSGKLEIISNPENPKFEIVAVHGLGANPKYTWSHPTALGSDNRTQAFEPVEPQGPPASPGRIHLLRDLIRKDFSEARILSFEHNSQWLLDAPVQTTAAIGQDLLRELESKHSSHLPIIFIGHSLGGIIIKEALYRDASKGMIKDVSGIIFLGTPHQGSSVSKGGAILAFMTRFLGSEPSLLLSLGRHSNQLSDLNERFGKLIPKDKIIAFYERKPMKVLGYFSLGQVVPRNSAVEHSDEDQRHGFYTDHSGLNKCAGPEDPLYEKLKESIHSLRAPSLLEQADTVIRNDCYTYDRLSIVRLSSDPLPMEQCYINLAMIEQDKGTSRAKKDDNEASLSRSSLFVRQKVETPDETVRVDLSGLFDERTTRDGRALWPRRILIRGQAGVGKTTLCKKIVYDFTHGIHTKVHKSWTKIFDRILWVPLRNLKGQSPRMEDLFFGEYFVTQGHRNDSKLAEVLWQEVGDTNGKRTLFLLDGLDEVSHLFDNNDGSRLLEQLLKQQNVIITSRPNLPTRISDIHLELETVGFYPDQVGAYIDVNSGSKERASEIHAYLQKHRLMQGLVRIPIQLDALCYTWEGDNFGTAPDTMTGMYGAIELKLWKKDVTRLGRLEERDAKSSHPGQLLQKVESEIALLECLAFNGICSDVIVFTPTHRGDIPTQLLSQLKLPLEQILSNLSFLRTSDLSLKPEARDYHFIHLTFQEYFAARYFVRKWKEKGHEGLAYVFKGQRNNHSDTDSDPIKFLQRHKYSARYDVFWRFVAGLLAAEEDDTMIADLFHKIQKEPLDLLGPTHQRLIMHCLSEVPRDKNLPCRMELEESLREWLLFEYRYRKKVDLARDMEFPEHALDAAFDEGTDEMKRAVLQAVSERATLPNRMLKSVTSWLDDEDSDVRRAAVEALGHRPDLPEGILNALAARLDGGEEGSGVRRAAVEALGHRPDLPEGILNALAARLDDEDWRVRRAAVEALGNRPDLPEGILNALAARLDGGEEGSDVRRAAVEALGHRPDLPEGILNALAARLAVRRAAVEALGNRAAVEALGNRPDLPEGILNALAARLDHDEDWRVRRAAVEALGNRPDLPEGILNALAARLDDEKDSPVRHAAVEALGHRPDLPEGILNALAARLDDEDSEDVRHAAVEALGNRPDLPEGILNALAARLDHDEDWRVRYAAVRVLGNRPDLPEGILNALAARLDHEHWPVRHAAVEALGHRPDLPEGILNALAARLDDEHWPVRRAAVGALLREQKVGDLLEDHLVISLYKALLEFSFKEQFSWYIDDSGCCINTSEGTRRIFVSSQTDIVKARPDGFPAFAVCGGR